MFFSEIDRRRLARPERRTGRANMLWTRRAAAGLLLWFLARPAGKTENSALLYAEIRPWM